VSKEHSYPDHPDTWEDTPLGESKVQSPESKVPGPKQSADVRSTEATHSVPKTVKALWAVVRPLQAQVAELTAQVQLLRGVAEGRAQVQAVQAARAPHPACPACGSTRRPGIHGCPECHSRRVRAESAARYGRHPAVAGKPLQ
jgi:hypothetical protein